MKNPIRKYIYILIIKNIKCGELETEMEVPSIDEANSILEQLGFSFRNYQKKIEQLTMLMELKLISFDNILFLHLLKDNINNILIYMIKKL